MSAEKQRRYRARKRAGRGVVRAEVDLIGLVDLLIATKHLSRFEQDDFVAVERATADFIEACSQVVAGNATTGRRGLY